MDHQEREERACRLSDRIAVLAERLERTDIAEFVEFYKRPGRVIYVSFVGGLARGLGIAIGTTALCLVFYLLTFVVELNLPLISRVIARSRRSRAAESQDARDTQVGSGTARSNSEGSRVKSLTADAVHTSETTEGSGSWTNAL